MSQQTLHTDTKKPPATHTPGPWYSNGAGIRLAVENSQYTIAHLAGIDAEANANAHLIAAAPDLLAVLKKVASRWEDTFPAAPVRQLEDPCYLEIRAAIAKAEGRS